MSAEPIVLIVNPSRSRCGACGEEMGMGDLADAYADYMAGGSLS